MILNCNFRMITLMYHDVYATSPGESGFQNESAFRYKIDSKSFERQIEIVANHLKLKGIHNESVFFSFDDGGVSAYRVVAPLLEKYGFRGMFFISTYYIGTPGFLNAVQIKELYARGHVIGSHSHTHPSNITNEGVDLYVEWKESKRILETIVGPISKCSIPNGYQSDRVMRSIVESGYTEVYTSSPSTAISSIGGMKVFGRYGIHDITTDNDIYRILNSKLYRLKLSIRWSLLSFAKMVLGEHYHDIKKKLLKKQDC